MPIGRSIALFVIAGLCEIGGGYLVWQWWRNGSWWGLGVLGGLVLFLYGIVPTYQPQHFSRTYAAYGGWFLSCSPSCGAGASITCCPTGMMFSAGSSALLVSLSSCTHHVKPDCDDKQGLEAIRAELAGLINLTLRESPLGACAQSPSCFHGASASHPATTSVMLTLNPSQKPPES